MENVLNELWEARNPKDALFLSIIDGYEIKVSKEYPENIFYTKNDKVLINYNFISKYVLINYDLIWSVFESKFDLKFQETIDILTIMLLTHLELKGTTPFIDLFFLNRTHLKLKVITPQDRLLTQLDTLLIE